MMNLYMLVVIGLGGRCLSADVAGKWTLYKYILIKFSVK